MIIKEIKRNGDGLNNFQLKNYLWKEGIDEFNLYNLSDYLLNEDNDIELEIENINFNKNNSSKEKIDLNSSFIDNNRSVFSWSVNTISEKKNDIVNEFDIIQSQNKSSKVSHKTKHLVVSFPARSESVLTTDCLKNIESETMKHVGWGDLQRLCVVHADTSNLHFHVMLNRIDPNTFKAENVSFSHLKMMDIKKEIEKKYGLEEKKESKDKNKARPMRLYEINNITQSFTTYVRHEVIGSLDGISSWNELHNLLAEKGIDVKLKTNGLVFQEVNEKKNISVRGSNLGREFSKFYLEKRFGKYENKTIINLNKSSYRDWTSEKNRVFHLSFIENYKKPIIKLIKQSTKNLIDPLLEEIELLKKKKKLELEKIPYGKNHKLERRSTYFQYNNEVDFLKAEIKKIRDKSYLLRQDISFKKYLSEKAINSKDILKELRSANISSQTSVANDGIRSSGTFKPKKEKYFNVRSDFLGNLVYKTSDGGSVVESQNQIFIHTYSKEASKTLLDIMLLKKQTTINLKEGMKYTKDIIDLLSNNPKYYYMKLSNLKLQKEIDSNRKVLKDKQSWKTKSSDKNKNNGLHKNNNKNPDKEL